MTIVEHRCFELVIDRCSDRATQYRDVVADRNTPDIDEEHSRGDSRTTPRRLPRPSGSPLTMFFTSVLKFSVGWRETER